MERNIESCTTLSELVHYIQNYFKTKVFYPSDAMDSAGEWDFPNVDEQSFFYGHTEEHLYGYRTKKLSQNKVTDNRSKFLKRMKSCEIFSTQSHW